MPQVKILLPDHIEHIGSYVGYLMKDHFIFHRSHEWFDFKLTNGKRNREHIVFEIEFNDFNMKTFYEAKLGDFYITVHGGMLAQIDYRYKEEDYYKAIIAGYNFQTNSWDKFFFDYDF